MCRMSRFNETLGDTSSTLCKAQSTENPWIIQVIRCSSTGGFSLDAPQQKNSIKQKDDGRERYFSIRIPRKNYIFEHVQ